jgi:dTDP-4-amino-4,6-dideoxygalactose transaminase
MTFIATAASIVQTGAQPVFADIDPDTGNISPCALCSFLESRSRKERRTIRAIVPVHLYGLPGPIVELKAIAAEFKLKLVEEACQAHGARVRTPDGPAMAGTLGDAGCFSFYPGKNLGALGDGGAVTTNNEEVAERVSLLTRVFKGTRKTLCYLEFLSHFLNVLHAWRGIRSLMSRHKFCYFNHGRVAVLGEFLATFRLRQGCCTRKLRWSMISMGLVEGLFLRSSVAGFAR